MRRRQPGQWTACCEMQLQRAVTAAGRQLWLAQQAPHVRPHHLRSPCSCDKVILFGRRNFNGWIATVPDESNIYPCFRAQQVT